MRVELLGRDWRRVASAVTNRRHYAAMGNAIRHSGAPAAFLWRYLSGRGRYPWPCPVRTPGGRVTPIMNSWHDVQTVNEIFFRRDYGPSGPLVVVDIGANIGMATLYFLSGRPDAVVYAAEPVATNRARLLENVSGMADRVVLTDMAISSIAGRARFVIEPTGRYGGLAEFSTQNGEIVDVDCVTIGDYLAGVLDQVDFVDLVKIDTEGNEPDLVRAIPDRLRSRIGAVVWENNDGTTRWLGPP